MDTNSQPNTTTTAVVLQLSCFLILLGRIADLSLPEGEELRSVLCRSVSLSIARFLEASGVTVDGVICDLRTPTSDDTADYIDCRSKGRGVDHW